MKKLLAGLLALFVLTAALSLPSCIRIQKVEKDDTDPKPAAPETEAPEPDEPGPDEPGPDEPETEAPETEAPVIPVNFAYDDLLAQNQIPNLLSRYESVTITRTYDSGSTTESFWMRDGDRVLYDISVYDDGETAYSSEGGSYRGFDFTAPSGEPVTATKWATAEAETFDGWIDALVTDQLPSVLAGDMVILAEDDETYTVSLPETLVTDEGEEIPCSNTVVVNKGTLDMISFDWEYILDDIRNYGGFTVEYDGEKLGEDVLAAWDMTREVWLSVYTETAGERTEKFEYPVEWRLSVLPDEGFTVFSPAAPSENGAILLDTGGKTVEIYAYDEASMARLETDPEPLDELPFTLDDLREANRITNLLNRFGSVTLVNKTESYDYRTWYFRFGDSVVRYMYAEYTDLNGNAASTAYGSFGRDPLEREPDGGYIYYAAIPDTGEYLFTDTNADGEHYANDLTLTDSLFLGEVADITREGDKVTFRYVYEWDETGEEAQTISVNTSDLLMDSAVVGNGGLSMQILRGEEVPFEKELTEAFRKTRTVTVHWGEAGDRAYTLPADWAFSVGYFEDLTVFSDAAMKSEFPQPIPGDGKDYEVWVKENGDEPVPEETEPAPLEDYIGSWVSEDEASSLKISADGSFEYEMGGDGWFGTLVWTTEEKGLWASGGRYELVLTDGSTLQGDAFVTADGDGVLTFAQGGGAERYHRYCLIRAEYAEDSLPDCLEFTADRGEYAVKVLLTPEKPLKDFAFFSVKQENAADGSIGMSAVDLYKLADFVPEKPLLVTMTFGEAFPSYGFTYRGEDGVFRTFGIVQSGMDGSVIVTRTFIAMG